METLSFQAAFSVSLFSLKNLGYSGRLQVDVMIRRYSSPSESLIDDLYFSYNNFLYMTMPVLSPVEITTLPSLNISATLAKNLKMMFLL